LLRRRLEFASSGLRGLNWPFDNNRNPRLSCRDVARIKVRNSTDS